MHVHLNCAVSLDGRLAGDGPVRLSCAKDWARVHELRAWSDAILVGIGTVLSDDPSLRAKNGDDPVRVVLDSDGRTPEDARLRDGSVRTLLLHRPDTDPGPGVEGIPVARGPEGLDLASALIRLEDEGMERLMVEGGARVLRSFVTQGAWDKWTVYIAPLLLGTGPSLWDAPPLGLNGTVEPFGAGALWTFSPSR